jgi:Ca2+-binding RTX toxin-like protein
MNRSNAPARVPAAMACALVALALGLVAAPAMGATARWTCSASTAIASVAGKTPVNPLTTTKAPCAKQEVGFPKLTDSLGLAPGITAHTAYAVDDALPDNVRPLDQTAGAAAGVEGLSLQGSDGSIVIGVDAARSVASGSCANGVPVLGASSEVTGLTINGRKISADQQLTDLTDAISGSPLNALVWVKLNEQLKTATGIEQNAVHIKVIKDAGSSPLAEIWIAQSAISSASACDASADGNNPGTGTSGFGTGLPPVCAPGSILDVQRDLCIIPASQSGGMGEIVVGKPYQGPTGGTVVALNVARHRYHSPCLHGAGPKYAVVGTNHRDRITGTNRSDRILGRGGNDSLDAGRGRDCVDGGTGSDAVAGGIAPDRLYGGTGRDALNGGPGSDRMWGGPGNDSLNAAFGRDRVSAGSGNDLVNIATAGPPARAYCGSGFDKVRFNHNERRRTRACEVRHMLHD